MPTGAGIVAGLDRNRNVVCLLAQEELRSTATGINRACTVLPEEVGSEVEGDEDDDDDSLSSFPLDNLEGGD